MSLSHTEFVKPKVLNEVFRIIKVVLYCPLLSNTFNKCTSRNVSHISPGLSATYYRTNLVLEISLNQLLLC